MITVTITGMGTITTIIKFPPVGQVGAYSLAILTCSKPKKAKES